MTEDKPVQLEGQVCPLPLPHSERIILGHGSGGKLTNDLIARHFLPAFANPILQAGNDAALLSHESFLQILETPGSRLAVSTDSHVVWPLFFPGGDIGRLAICGTVNDISMLGARSFFLTAGFILEEGLSIELLDQVIHSMKAAALEAGIQIIAGDTKVVEKGKADGLYINTTGFGVIPPGVNIHGANAQPGDKVIISGTIGDHGMAVLEARGGLGFTAGLQSDVAPLNSTIQAILKAGCRVHVLRDPTRGGLATTLNEIAKQSRVCIRIDETSIPVRHTVLAACEMLGFDPLYVANEGKVIVITHPSDAEQVLAILKSDRYGTDASLIGEVADAPEGRVLLKTSIGATRIIDTLSGEMLPRIC